MALILVAEDDPGTLKLLSVVLQHQGHDVVETTTGTQAWDLIQRLRPDLVVSDINMPGMTGFDLLGQVRDDIDLALTPFILLTSLQERRDMRQGMRMGADDYLTKPFQSRELIDAVNAQLGKQALRAASQEMQFHARLHDALEAQARDLGDDYEDKLALALSQQWPGTHDEGRGAPELQGVLLCAGILAHDQWAATLPPPALAHLLKRFHESCGDTAHLFGASHMQFTGDGIVALYQDPSPTLATSPALRAIKAALGLQKSVAALRAFIARQHPGLALPTFDIGMAVHCGPVGLMRLEGLIGGAAQTVPVGQTVVDTLAIQRHAVGGGTPITVTVPVLRSITGAVVAAQRYLLALPHREQPIDVCRIEALTL